MGSVRRSSARRALVARLWFVTLWGGIAGCSAADVVAFCSDSLCGPVTRPPDASVPDAARPDAARPDAARPDASAGLDASVPDAAAGFCSGTGPVLLVGDEPGGFTCTGEVAAKTFRFAVCTCEALAPNLGLSVDAFDSLEGPYTAGHPGGSVGANGDFLAGEPVSIGGSLFVAGASGVTLHANGRLDVGIDGHIAAALDSAGDVEVGRDLSLGGRLETETADVVVAGTLTQSNLADRAVDGTVTAGTEAMASVTVGPPCGCAPSDLIDVGGYIERHRNENENTSIGLDPAALSDYVGPIEQSLPCGRYFLDAIDGMGELRIRVTGRAALFVAGDLRTDGDFAVSIEGDGELDLFIGGTIVAGAGLRLGSLETPAKVRVYVGGSEPISLGAGLLVAGNLYAPTAELTTAATVEAYGSLFVKGITANSPVVVHYDTAVLGAGAACPPTETACESACECGLSACVSGVCGACVTDADCCAPLLCGNGVCGVVPL